MNIPMIIRIHNGYTYRGIDQRPQNQVVQINVFNPQDQGHSMCFVVPCGEDAPSSLEDTLVMLESSGEIDVMIGKAHKLFFPE